MPKTERVAKAASPYARSAEEKEAARRMETAYKNPRETRRNQGVMVIPAADPHMPTKLWKGNRPSWGKPVATLRQEVIAVTGSNICRKAGCNMVGDEIDHKIDWRTFLYARMDPVVVNVPGGKWHGFRLSDVKRLYNDISNLQMMCGHHNGSKSGPKFYDRDRPIFTRN